MRPAQRRELVQWVRRAYQLTERRACCAVGVARSSVRYRSVRPAQDLLRRRLREMASVRVRSGYRQFYVLLRREGWALNHKRVYRIYKDEGLALARRRPRRHRTATRRPSRPPPQRANEVWAMDFVHDTTADGRPFRVLTVIDLFTRECVALEAARGFSGAAVGEALDQARRERGTAPSRIRVDNGTEFTSKVLDRWAWGAKVELDFSRPGKPTDNAFVEAFNGTLRRECLSTHWFLTIKEVQTTLRAWRADYNNDRPHSGLRGMTPAQKRQEPTKEPDPAEP